MVLSARGGAGAPGARPGVSAPGARPGVSAPGARPGAPTPGARPGGPVGARPGQTAAAQQPVDISDPSYEAAPPQQQATQQRPGPIRPGGAAPAQTPAVYQQPQPPAVATGGGNPKISELNPMLAGLEGMGDNNRVGITAAGFEYKGTGQFVQELNIVVTGGAKLWQKWGDADKGEEEGLCQSYDHKTSTDGLVCATCPFFKDKSCKFKFEIRWQEPEVTDEGETMAERVWTMPTSSALTWIDYLKELGSKLGVGAHQVNTYVGYEVKKSGSNIYACATFTPTHWYDEATGTYTDIPDEQRFMTRNKK